MWLAFVGGPVMIAKGGYEYNRTSRLKTEGVRTRGTLVDSDGLDTGKGRRSYRITLDYKSKNGETTYRKMFVVTEALYNQARRAGQAQVTFLPDDPGVSTAGDHIPVKSEFFAIGGGLILFALVVWRYRRRQMRSVESYLVGEA